LAQWPNILAAKGIDCADGAVIAAVNLDMAVLLLAPVES
jgi:hypothetical protein